MSQSTPSSTLLTVGQAADYLSLKRSRVYDLVRQRRIPHYKIGSSLRFRVDELDKWLEDECTRS